MKLFTAAAFAALLMAPGGAAAQDFASAFSGFDSGSGEPIQIEADQLEVRDAEKIAVYSGHVRVLQGGTLLETPTLRVFYTGDAPAQGGQGTPGNKVSRLEAGPGVMVRDGDKTASSDRAVFEMDTDLVTMSGNVVLTQGTSVARGQRFVVNLATNEGRIDGGRVQTLITPSGENQPKP